jgi:hypothetical protein
VSLGDPRICDAHKGMDCKNGWLSKAEFSLDFIENANQSTHYLKGKSCVDETFDLDKCTSADDKNLQAFVNDSMFDGILDYKEYLDAYQGGSQGELLKMTLRQRFQYEMRKSWIGELLNKHDMASKDGYFISQLK